MGTEAGLFAIRADRDYVLEVNVLRCRFCSVRRMRRTRTRAWRFIVA